MLIARAGCTIFPLNDNKMLGGKMSTDDVVIYLTEQIRLLHARNSTGSRAARAASKSAETPASRARDVESSPDQYSAGILSRCHHLETCVADAPGTSAAMEMREPCEVPHSSIIARNDVKSVMAQSLGQSVLKSKAVMSLDCGSRLGQNVRMADSETETQYKQSFTRRIAEARTALGWKQWQMAEALGMPQDKYKQYEGRSLLPHHLIRRFCLIARVDMEWLVTGQGKMKLAPLPEIVPDIQPAPKTKVRRTGRRVA